MDCRIGHRAHTRHPTSGEDKLILPRAWELAATTQALVAGQPATPQFHSRSAEKKPRHEALSVVASGITTGFDKLPAIDVLRSHAFDRVDAQGGYRRTQFRRHRSCAPGKRARR